MGGQAGTQTGVQTKQQNLLGAPGILDRIRGSLLGPEISPSIPVGQTGSESRASTQATKTTGATIDRRRKKTTGSGRLTAPRAAQRRTLLGE